MRRLSQVALALSMIVVSRKIAQFLFTFLGVSVCMVDGLLVAAETHAMMSMFQNTVNYMNEEVQLMVHLYLCCSLSFPDILCSKW